MQIHTNHSNIILAKTEIFEIKKQALNADARSDFEERDCEHHLDLTQ
jgi:hypothetical protein